MKLDVISTVRDTVSPADLVISDLYQGVLAYRDGPYRWMPGQVERFLKAGKKIYPISVTGADPHRAQVVDCENGDLTITGAATYARQRDELHGDATVYVSLANVFDLVGALGDTPCWLWVAYWSSVPLMPPVDLPPNIHIAAVQHFHSMVYDESAIITRSWPAHPYQTMANW